MQSNSGTSQGIIWAFGNTNPDDSAVDATLLQHIDSGPLTLDLSTPLILNSDGTATLPSSSNNTSGAVSVPLLPYQKKIIAHGILCVIGFLGLLPLGALVARYFRTFTPVWFQAHWIIQLALGTCCRHSNLTHSRAIARETHSCPFCSRSDYHQWCGAWVLCS